MAAAIGSNLLDDIQTMLTAAGAIFVIVSFWISMAILQTMRRYRFRNYILFLSFTASFVFFEWTFNYLMTFPCGGSMITLSLTAVLDLQENMQTRHLLLLIVAIITITTMWNLLIHGTILCCCFCRIRHPNIAPNPPPPRPPMHNNL